MRFRLSRPKPGWKLDARHFTPSARRTQIALACSLQLVLLLSYLFTFVVSRTTDSDAATTGAIKQISLRPSANGTVTGWTNNAASVWADMSDDPDSANDATSYASGPNAADGSMFVQLDDMPTDFVAVKSVTVHAKAAKQSTDDLLDLYGQIYQSDETTAITAESTSTRLAAGWSTSNFSVRPVIVSGAQDKTTWDGARLRLRQDWTVTSTTDATALSLITAVEVNITYVAKTPALLDQRASIWENDDEDQAVGDVVDENTQAQAANTAVTDAKKGESLTLRTQIRNTGGALDGTQNMGLFYDRNDGIWSRVRTAAPVMAAGSCADTTFGCTSVESTNVVGLNTSTALDGSGAPWISYYDSTNGDLRIAREVGAGGAGCASTAWNCSAVVSTNNVGSYNAIAMDDNDLPWIAYYDSTAGDLKIAQYVTSGGTGCATVAWTCTTIDSTNTVGAHLGLAFSAAGKPWISYYDTTNGDLRVAQYVGSGGSGCASAAWTCTAIESTNNVGQYTSIGFDADGSAWIAYYDVTNGDLRVAKYVGSGGTGCATAVWTCTAIESTNSVGQYTAIAADPTGAMWITYYDTTNGDLRVAQYVGSSGTGCASAAWTCTSPDTTNDVGKYSSIAFDPAGHAWVSSYDTTNGDLRYARYTGGSGSGCTLSTWTCSSIDTTNDVGQYSSLAFGPDGTSWMAAYDVTNGDLRTANLSRGGELLLSPGIAGADGDALQESHADMSSVSDTANRNDADCSGGGTWNNGKWYEREVGSNLVLADGTGTAQCTEVAFTVDTSPATASRQYRFVVATSDVLRADHGRWRGPATITAYPSLTIEASTTTRISKDVQLDTANCSDSGWGCSTVDSTGSVGNYSSISRGADGSMWFVEGNTGIKVGQYVESGGTGCATTAWTCTAVDTTTTMTFQAKITTDSKGTPWVVYADGASGDLRVAWYVGSGGSGCATSTWNCVGLDTTNAVGSYASIAFDGNDMPWISYHDSTNLDLRVARPSPTGGTGCAVSNWTCVAIDSTNSVGQYAAIAVDGNDAPWISYQDATNGDLRIAHFVGAGGSGCALTTWTCLSVDTTNTVGLTTSISIDASGNPFVVHYDSTNTDLRSAQYVGSGGTGCAGSAAWTCSIVDTNSSLKGDAALAIDAEGKPWIAMTNSGSTTQFWVARYVGAGGVGCSSAAWACKPVDMSTAYSNFVSIAFDGSGVPWMAAYDSTNLDLRVAKLRAAPTLADDRTAMSTLAPAGLSAPRSDGRHRLSGGTSPRSEVGTCSGTAGLTGYCGVATSDGVVDGITAQANQSPEYALAYHATAASTSNLSVTWTGKSTTAPSSKAISVQIYVVNAASGVSEWQTVAPTTDSCSAAAANTTCTLEFATRQSATSYQFLRNGLYTSWVRVVQAADTSAMTLSTDSFAMAWSDFAPSKIDQVGSIWENDDEDQASGDAVDENSQLAAGSTALTGVRKGERLTLRTQLSNSGGGLPESTPVGVFYDRGDGIWSKVQANAPLRNSAGSCADTTFACTTVYSTNTAGSYTSTIVDAKGATWGSYYDATAGDLKFFKRAGGLSSGCADTSWTCVTIESTNDVGSYSRMTMDPAGNPLVAYYDVTNGDLRVATFVGAGGTGCATVAWTCVALDSTNNVGQYVGVARDAAGKPWVSYYDVTNGDLRVARYVGSGGTGCASTAWTCTTVESTNDIGQYSSIAFDAAGNAWIAYADVTNGDLRVAEYVGVSGTGCASSAWSCASVDSSGTTGQYTSIAADSEGKMWISYYDSTSGDLRLARYVSSSGTGCAAATWTCTTVDSSNDVGKYTSLAFDPAGKAWITFYDVTNGDLRYSRYTGSGGSGCAISSWTCSSIDTTNDVGQYGSIAFGVDGNAWVSSYDATNGDLRSAYVNRGGEISIASGLAGASGDVLNESHAEMTTTSDTTSRDDADCIGGGTWRNGVWFDTEDGLGFGLNSGLSSAQCSEIAFVLDTTNATLGQQYRFFVATDDGFTSDRSRWRGSLTTSTFPSATIEAVTSTRVSKTTQFDMANCTSTAWGCAAVDSTGSVGTYTQMAFGPDGTPWIVMFDATNSKVRVVHYVGSGGSGCATSAWDCASIFYVGLGAQISIAVDETGSPWISFYDNGFADLYVAHYVGSGGSGCLVAAWTCTAVDTANTVGQWSSIALDRSGNPWVSYYDGTNADLRLAHYVGSGGSGCNVAFWTCVTVHSTGDVGQYTSLAFDSSGIPWISFYDVTNLDLKVARLSGVGGACTSTAFLCYSVYSSGSVGQWSSIGFDTSGNPWVTFYDTTNLDVRIAQFVGGAGGTGCAQATWNCTAIESTNSVGPHTSVAVDPAGNPWAAYYYTTGLDLKVGRYVSSGGTGCATAAWSCSAVETTGSVGTYPSIAFDRDGTPWVSYYDATNLDLRVAKMHQPPGPPAATGSGMWGRSAGGPDSRYHLDDGRSPRSGSCVSTTGNMGYCGVSADDTTADSMTTSVTEQPMYVESKRATVNTTLPSMSWTGQSTSAPSSKAITAQVWNNTTKAWETPGTLSNGCTAAGANTDCTITAAATGTASDFYESVGGVYWAHFRVFQVYDTSAITMKTDEFSMVTGGVNTDPDAPSSLAQYKSNGSTSIATGGWTNETSVVLKGGVTDPDSDATALCAEVASALTSPASPSDCGSTVASGATASVTISGLASGTTYKWQAKSKDSNAAYSSTYTQFNSGSNAFTVDTANPTGGTVYDGTSAGVDFGYNDGSLSSLSANWSGFSDALSGIASYDYSIGTTAGGTTILSWTSNALLTSVTATGLTLQTGQLYYVNVRANDTAGNSVTVSSDGQQVAPTLSFSISPSSITMNDLTAMNSYTDTEVATLTTSTNAYNGYSIKAYETQVLTSGSNTINDYAGSWSTPSTWTGYGFGYTSSDTSVSGSDRFVGGTKYAAFSGAAPGDVVADHAATVSGSPISNESFTMTLKAAVAATQPSGTYQTTLIVSCVASF